MRTKIKDKVYYDENYRVVLHDAEIRLKNRCLETAQAKYGNPLPDFVKSFLTSGRHWLQFRLLSAH